MHAPNPTPTRLSRRKFLALSSGCVACSHLSTGRARAATDRPIDVGTLKDFPKDEISEKFIQHDIFVVRDKGKLFANTAICPHKGGYLLRDPKKASRIICSNHNWTFDAQGEVLSGDKGRGLVRYAIAVNDKGRVIVDTSREFPQPKWGEKDSHIPIR